MAGTESRNQGLEALVAGLFPLPVGVGITNPLTYAGRELFHVEQAAIRNAIPARQREFRAGRAAARAAQVALGLAPRPVPMGDDRAPVWPAGLSGSISHTGDTCIAVLCNDPVIAALGLDIEEDAPLPADILDTVLAPDERRWISQQADPGRMARLFFSAKECAYKAQYPLTRQLFGFEVITISADPGAGRFEARFTRPMPPFASGTRLAGRLSVTHGLIITAIALRA